MALKISVRERGGVAIMDLDGRIVIGDGAEQLNTAARSLLAEGRKKLLINLAGVGHVDSVGLGSLVACHMSAGRQSAQFKLLKPLKHLTNLLAIPKLITVLEVFASEEEAVMSFSEEFAAAA